MKISLRTISAACLVVLLTVANVQAADTAPALAVAAIKSPIELCVVAAHARYQTVIDAAESQQVRDSQASQPPATDVVDPNNPVKILGRWLPVSNTQQDWKQLGFKTRERRLKPTDEKSSLELLVAANDDDIRLADFKSFKSGVDFNGTPCVDFAMTDAGATRLRRLTSAHLPKDGAYFHLAIVIHGKILSAPRLQDVVGDRGQISGNFTAEEVEKLIQSFEAAAGRK